jgi:hypothetical protein
MFRWPKWQRAIRKARIFELALIVALSTIVVLASAGCGGSSSKGSSNTKATTKGTPTQASELIGFGATTAAWDANHQADDRNGFTPGSGFDPDPSLARGGDQRFNDKYYGVIHDDPIISYEMRFPSGTNIERAKQSVLASEFPDDAKVVWFKRLDTCAQMIVRSKKVAAAINSAALVEFGSGVADDQYDPKDVWTAILVPIESMASSSGDGC